MKISNRALAAGLVVTSLLSFGAMAAEPKSSGPSRAEEIKNQCMKIKEEKKRIDNEIDSLYLQKSQVENSTLIEIGKVVQQLPGITDFISTYRTEATAIRLSKSREQLENLTEVHLTKLRGLIETKFAAAESFARSRGARTVKKSSTPCKPGYYKNDQIVFIDGPGPVTVFSSPENTGISDYLRQLTIKSVWSSKAEHKPELSHECYSTLAEARDVLAGLNLEGLRERVLRLAVNNEITSNNRNNRNDELSSGDLGFGRFAKNLGGGCTSTLTCQANPELVQKMKEAVDQQRDSIRTVTALNALDDTLRESIQKLDKSETELRKQWLDATLGKKRTFEAEDSAVTPCDFTN